VSVISVTVEKKTANITMDKIDLDAVILKCGFRYFT